MKKEIELLAPAGILEKLKYAIHYGADAVYCGVPDVSMRARVNAFTEEDLKEAASYVHERGKKIFVTLNIYAHNYHLEKIEKHLKFLKKIGIDGVIVSDLGILSLVKDHLPDVDIHLSTQANTTNWRAAKFWHDLGVKRIVLAREVTLEDIKEIHEKVPELELEYFVHGAMCMSYSGRCILSKWMSGKSANLGDCSQPCRWAYVQKSEIRNSKSETNFSPPAGGQIPNSMVNEFKTMTVEDIRGEHEVELEEDSHGTYFFNSKDLNLLEHLKDLHEAGVMSFKIEGRNKSVFYVASVVRAYRNVLNRIAQGSSQKDLKKAIDKEQRELDSLVNRGYTKGFLLGNEAEHNFSNSHEKANFQFVGEIKKVQGNTIFIKAHNAIYPSDSLEIMGKQGTVKISIEKIMDEKGGNVASAHGGQKKLFQLCLEKSKIKSDKIEPMSLLRKAV